MPPSDRAVVLVPQARAESAGPRRPGRRTAPAIARALAALAAALALPAAAAAMDVRTAPDPASGRFMIYATGAIDTGDVGRLRHALYEAGNRRPHLVVNSGGGLLQEGVRIARMVAAERVPVTAGEVCASACFLVLAASPDRSADPSSRVGVHRAYSPRTGESAGTLDASVDVARYAASLGVPAPILARMVTTPGSGSSIAWLSAEDLRSMDVRPTRQAAAAAAAPAAQQQPAGGAAGHTTEAGRADRAAYRRWLAGLPDGGREGAAYWARQRLQPRPGNCLKNGDSVFSLACFEAQRWLARADERSRDPGYRRGWEGQ